MGSAKTANAINGAARQLVKSGIFFVNHPVLSLPMAGFSTQGKR